MKNQYFHSSDLIFEGRQQWFCTECCRTACKNVIFFSKDVDIILINCNAVSTSNQLRTFQKHKLLRNAANYSSIDVE